MLYFLLYIVFALWVLLDSFSRKIRTAAFFWALGTALLGPVILPIYLASRPLKEGEVREGGTAWNILKNFAVLWTVLMVIASIVVVIEMAKRTSELTGEGAQTGTGIGIAMGLVLFAAAWFIPTAGAALLGFLLKKTSAIEAGPTGPLIGQGSTANRAGGWAGLAGAAFVGLIVVGAASLASMLHSDASKSKSQNIQLPIPPQTSKNEWALLDSNDAMDNIPIVTLSKSSDDGARLIVRCAKHKTEAYVDTETVTDNANVRIRFDQSAPMRQSWTRSTDYQALFAPDAVSFARELAKAKTFMIEFTPFQRGTRTISFDVSGLESGLPRIAEACDWAGVDRGRVRSAAEAAALRAKLAPYVHPCKDQEIGKWCWSDPDDVLFQTDSGFADTREKALDDAVQSARWGLAFQKK